MAPNGTVLNRLDINTFYQDQILPDLAFNSQYYLVAWLDRRDHPAHIYYTLVTPDGRVLNDNGIQLSGTDSSDYYTLPAVASNEDQYLVAWLGNRISGDVILGARVDGSGEIIDSMPFEFSSDTLLIGRVAVKSDGQNYLVVWSCETPGLIGSDLYFRRLSAQGEMLDTAPVLIARTEQGLSDPAVTSGSGFYFVVWSEMNDERDIYGCRILSDGTVLDPEGIPICADTGSQFDPAVASDGERFLVNWTDARTGNYDIYATLVDSSGSVGLKSKLTKPAWNRLKIEVYPVPAKSQTVVRFNLPSEQEVNLSIYDVGGRLVRKLITGIMPAGFHQAIWDRKDIHGRVVPSGTYFCRICLGIDAFTRRIIWLESTEP